MWAFPSCSSPPIMHQVVRNHGNHHLTQVSSPQLLPSCLAQGPGLENLDWTRSQLPSQFPSMPSSYTYCDQNQDLDHLDLHLQTHTQTQFDSGLSCDPLQSEVFCFPDPQCLLSASPDVDPWGPLEPVQTQGQSSGLGSVSGAVDPLRWRSAEFSSGLTDNFYSALSEFYPNSYHDDGASQPFCSPSTPGPSPHYPQVPFVSSPSPRISPAFHTQDTTLPFPMTSDPGHHPLPPIQDRAGLRWSDGGGKADWTEIRGGSAGSEAADSRLLCSVCNRDFHSLPALNGHMRSHGSCRSASRTNQKQDTPPPMPTPTPTPTSQPAPTPVSVSVVMPVSVPVRSKRGGGYVQRRRSRAASAGSAVLYSSLMRCLISEEEGGGARHYTPPPMLSPLRAGPGLYWSLSATNRGQQRPPRPPAHRKQKDSSSRTTSYVGSSHPVTMETAPPPSGILMSGNNTPCINVGRDFQAEIPPLLDLKYVHSDSHNALLLWAPWAELERAANQQRVEAMLMLTRSSVVPGGGASPEYVLQLLSESRGDFLVTLEKLLSNPEPNNTKQRGGQWSPSESKSLVQSLQLHQKDFISVQRDVQTKTLSQCVEFYYLWKKKLNLRIRTRTGLTVTLPNTRAGPGPGPRPGPGPEPEL